MPPETHVFVIWDKGRRWEARILADIRTNFEVFFVGEVAFPCDAKEGYCRFYGTRRFNVRKKVSRCGKGPFLVIIVRDDNPRHVIDEQGKIVNEKVYRRKHEYRIWVNGNHRVHSSLTVDEYARDIYRLTGHTAEEWSRGTPAELHMELPPFDSIPPPAKRPIIQRLLKHLGFRKGNR